MFPLTLREAKGSPLTHQEMDNNLKHVMFPPFLHIQDQKPQGTNGGTFTSGAWWTRDLNTVLTNTIVGASLANNRITLPAGKYYVEASAVAQWVNRNTTRLYDMTGTTLLEGLAVQSYFVDTGNSSACYPASLNGQFIISSESILELQHICQRTANDRGFGVSTNLTTEVYSDIRIWRIGEYEE